MSKGGYKKLIVLISISIFLFSSLSSASNDYTKKNNSIETQTRSSIQLNKEYPTIVTKEVLSYPEDSSVHFHQLKNPTNSKNTGFIKRYYNIIVPTDYATIQEAINHAKSGNRIFVRSGTYNENIIIKKSIIIIGENKETTIIKGDGTEDVVMIKSGYIDMSGFTIKNGKNGITLNASSGNTIQNNNIFDNSINGINMFRAYGNFIKDNTIEKNMNTGIYVFSSFGNRIQENNIKSNEKNNILIEKASRKNVIVNNDIQNSEYGLKINDGAENNLIHLNAFIENDNNAYDSSMNTWDDTCRGNFWDDYTGIDSNSDSIGDTPYFIDGGINKDNYPLMNQLIKETINDLEYDYFPYKEKENPKKNTVPEPQGTFSVIIVPDDYQTIQEAINHANTGDKIEVKSGVYYENLIVNKTLSITGSNKDTTIIDADNEGNVIHISADNVEITGFTIRNTGLESAGIKTTSNENLITDNIITECGVGIHLSESIDSEINDNRIYGNNWGIFLDFSDDTIINNNNLVGNNDGMMIFQSNHNQIMSNRVNNNRYQGILNFNCLSNKFNDNTIEDNEDYGIQIFNSRNTVINNNIFDENGRDAITLYKSNNNTFTLNEIYEGPNGISLWYNSEENLVSNNIFSNLDENGIIIQKSCDNVIENNEIKDCKNNAIYLCALSSKSRIESNIFQDCSNYGFSIDYANSTNVVNNHFYDCSLNVLNTHSNTIESNLVNGKPLIYLEGISNKLITDAGQVIIVNCNNISLTNLDITSIQVGIEVIDSQETYIQNCNLSHNKLYGIYIHENSKNIHISNNEIRSNTIAGVYLNQTGYIVIEENSIIENTYGLNFEKAHNNEIKENEIMNNNEIGIFLTSQSKWNTIADNTIKNNIETGIKTTSDSSYNNISKNNIIENGYGIELSASPSCTIAENTIKNNENDGIYSVNNNMNKIKNNIIEYNKNGVNLEKSDSTIVELNVIQYNSDDGIKINNAYDNVLRSNELSFNKNGLYLHNCENSEIEYNTLAYNKNVGISEYFSSQYPIEAGEYNQISRNNFIENNQQAYFRSSQGGILIGYFWYFGLNNWDKNYWDDWTGSGDKVIIGDMYVYSDIFSVPVWMKDHYPSSEQFHYNQPSTTPVMTKSILTTSVSDYNDYNQPTNRFQINTHVISYNEMDGAKNGDDIKWEWYHNGEIQKVKDLTVTLDGSIAFWDGWTPDEIGWWHIKIYHNGEQIGSSPEFIIYQQNQELIHTLLTDQVRDRKPEPVIDIPSTFFKQGNPVFTYSEMMYARNGDKIRWDWIHNQEIRHTKTETIPYDGTVAFWDDWVPDQLGSWHVNIYCNDKFFGMSPEFEVVESIDQNRIGLGEAMTCSWINVNESSPLNCGPQELISGENETMHCYATITAQRSYDWYGDTISWKWYHNNGVIAEEEETINSNYKGIVTMFFSVPKLPVGTGHIKFYVNGNYVGKTNTYEVMKGYQDITPIIGIAESLTCKWAHDTNYHGPFQLHFTTNDTIHFYSSFLSKSYNWYSDTFTWKWYHNDELIAEKTETNDEDYTGIVAFYDSQSQLPVGSGYITLYWNGEYCGKTNQYTIS